MKVVFRDRNLIRSVCAKCNYRIMSLTKEETLAMIDEYDNIYCDKCLENRLKVNEQHTYKG